ncbi:hypothetical protein U1Q18_032749 [Sarracenia purpurea var. burkii]
MNKLQGKGGFIPRSPNRFRALSALGSDEDGGRFLAKGELSRSQRARAPQLPKGLENGNQDLTLLLKSQEIFRDAANVRIELLNFATNCSLDSKSRKAAAKVEKSIKNEVELTALGSSFLILTDIKSDEESPSSVAPYSSNLRLEERRSRRGCMESIEVSTRDIEEPRR